MGYHVGCHCKFVIYSSIIFLHNVGCALLHELSKIKSLLGILLLQRVQCILNSFTAQSWFHWMRAAISGFPLQGFNVLLVMIYEDTKLISEGLIFLSLANTKFGKSFSELLAALTVSGL